MYRKNNRRHTTGSFLAVTMSLMVILAACASPVSSPMPTTMPRPTNTATTQPQPTVVPAATPTAVATAAPTPKPTESNLSPQACVAQGKLTYTHPADRYCFAYPTRFKLEQAPTGQPILYGPALESSPDPLRASLAVEVEVAVRDKSLAQIVDGYVSQFAKLPLPPIQRTKIQLGGEPAEMLEVVPGREGSRDVFMLHDGTLFHLMFMPSVRDFPKAKADVEELYQAVVTSFSLLPVATGGSLMGQVLIGTTLAAGLHVQLQRFDDKANGYVEVAQAEANDSGQFALQNPPVGDYILVGFWPDGQPSVLRTPVHIEAGQAITDAVVKLVKTLQIVEPIPGAQTDATPILRWNSILGITQYRVLVIDAGTTEPMLDQIVKETSLAIKTPLKSGRTYDWVVNAEPRQGSICDRERQV